MLHLDYCCGLVHGDLIERHMTPSREDALYRQVLETPQDRQGVFLECVCAGDDSLKRRLMDRIASDTELEAQADQTTAMSNSEIQAGPLPPPSTPRDEAIGQILGRFRLTDKLGEGGCGAVYVAEQTEPVRRLVAVKGIKLGMDTKQVVAREAYRQALAIKEQRPMPPDYKLADAHLNLSALLLDLGDYSQGEAEAREALEGYRAVFGGSHPRVGMALHNRGKALGKLARIEAAETALRGALDVYRQVYASDHAYIAEALDDLGQIQQQKGDRTGSERSFRESLDMAKRLLGENHPSTLTAMRHLALLKATSPVDPEAEQWIQRAVNLARQRYSKQPAVMAITFDDWGQYLVRTGRPAEAVPVLLQAHQFAVDAKRSALEHQRLARQLGEIYQQLGNAPESKRWTTEADRMATE